MEKRENTTHPPFCFKKPGTWNNTEAEEEQESEGCNEKKLRVIHAQEMV